MRRQREQNPAALGLQRKERAAQQLFARPGDMPQKHLFKSGKKSKGKAKPPSRVSARLSKTKKGRLSKPPKSQKDKAKWKQDKETTRAINAFNEKGALTKAASHGEKYTMVGPAVAVPTGPSRIEPDSRCFPTNREVGQPAIVWPFLLLTSFSSPRSPLQLKQPTVR